MSKQIGDKLRHLRQSRKMTQEEVAKATEYSISRSTLSNYEVGRRTPHLTELQRLASVFNVGLEYFDISASDFAVDLLSRAKEVFNSKDVPAETKEDLYLEFLRLYIDMKGNKVNDNS